MLGINRYMFEAKIWKDCKDEYDVMVNTRVMRMWVNSKQKEGCQKVWNTLDVLLAV